MRWVNFKLEHMRLVTENSICVWILLDFPYNYCTAIVKANKNNDVPKLKRVFMIIEIALLKTGTFRMMAHNRPSM